MSLTSHSALHYVNKLERRDGPCSSFSYPVYTIGCLSVYSSVNPIPYNDHECTNIDAPTSDGEICDDVEQSKQCLTDVDCCGDLRCDRNRNVCSYRRNRVRIYNVLM